MLNDTNTKRLDTIISRYPHKQAALLPALYIAQEQEGYITQEMMKFIADYLGIPFGHVLGVVTFYTMFYDKPQGKYHIQVCTNISCQLLGSNRILGHLEKRCGIRPGESTPDMKFTLSEVECLGSCGTAPVMQVNNDYFENLTPQKIDNIIDSFK
jgi:NADH-quinone oxidoreductase E subunit